jgi:hypothetical protein
MLSRGEVNVFGDCEALNVVWDGDEALVELKKHSNGCGRCEVQQEKMRWKRCCFWILATWKISGELNFIMFVVSNGRRFDWFSFHCFCFKFLAKELINATVDFFLRTTHFARFWWGFGLQEDHDFKKKWAGLDLQDGIVCTTINTQTWRFRMDWETENCLQSSKF